MRKSQSAPAFNKQGAISPNHIIIQVKKPIYCRALSQTFTHTLLQNGIFFQALQCVPEASKSANEKEIALCLSTPQEHIEDEEIFRIELIEEAPHVRNTQETMDESPQPPMRTPLTNIFRRQTSRRRRYS